MAWLFALLGFGPSEVQGRTPPILAYLLAVPVALFAGTIIEWSTFLIEWASFGYATRFWVSVVFRTAGVIATLVLVQAVYRVIVHGDDHSWAGWIRKLILPLTGPR